MPEAPEVQTVISVLESQIKNLKIKNVNLYYPKLVETGSLGLLVNESFRTFSRIGKYLIFGLDHYDLIVHLRMEGKFYLYDSYHEDKHIHAILTLADGRYLCYHDTRKFGRFYIYPKGDVRSYSCFKNVGLDYLEADSAYFYAHIHHLKKNLKSALLDQSIIAGVGNIYADEICFCCGLDPRSRCSRISKKDCERIIIEMKRILQGATKYGGTTIRSYTSSLGVTGRFQLHLHVHDQKVCKVCGSDIKKIVVSQRGTYICPKCQKRK